MALVFQVFQMIQVCHILPNFILPSLRLCDTTSNRVTVAPQSAFICSKLIIETLKQGVKDVQS